MSLSRRKFLRSLAVSGLAMAAACTPKALDTPAQPTETAVEPIPGPTETAPTSTKTVLEASPTAAPIPILAREECNLKAVAGVSEVARLIGEGSINDTPGKWELSGADLGSMFDKGDKLYMVFGDSFGCCIPGTGGPGNATDWRYNCMAVITDREPGDGLTFDEMLTDRPGHAKQLVPRGKFDKTLIPTYGVAIGERMVLHYMAVLAWGNPGEWVLNEAGYAYSDDDGETWTKDPQMKWPGKTNFGQVAFVKHEDFLYLFGIPGGRLGGVKLARVPIAQTFEINAYRYYAGSSEQDQRWVADEADGVLIIPPMVGELSVIWNDYLERWIMAYLDHRGGGLVLREAKDLWGPWSDMVPLVSGQAFPGLYGSYMHPWYVENQGETIYFAMSRWDAYAVYWMKARLARA